MYRLVAGATCVIYCGNLRRTTVQRRIARRVHCRKTVRGWTSRGSRFNIAMTRVCRVVLSQALTGMGPRCCLRRVRRSGRGVWCHGDAAARIGKSGCRRQGTSVRKPRAPGLLANSAALRSCRRGDPNPRLAAHRTATNVLLTCKAARRRPADKEGLGRDACRPGITIIVLQPFAKTPSTGRLRPRVV